MDRQTDKIHRQTDTQTDRHTDRQTGKHTDRETHRQTNKQRFFDSVHKVLKRGSHMFRSLLRILTSQWPGGWFS